MISYIDFDRFWMAEAPSSCKSLMLEEARMTDPTRLDFFDWLLDEASWLGLSYGKLSTKGSIRLNVALTHTKKVFSGNTRWDQAVDSLTKAYPFLDDIAESYALRRAEYKIKADEAEKTFTNAYKQIGGVISRGNPMEFFETFAEPSVKELYIDPSADCPKLRSLPAYRIGQHYADTAAEIVCGTESVLETLGTPPSLTEAGCVVDTLFRAEERYGCLVHGVKELGQDLGQFLGLLPARKPPNNITPLRCVLPSARCAS